MSPLSPLSSLSLESQCNARKSVFYENIRPDVFLHFTYIFKIYSFIEVFIIFLCKSRCSELKLWLYFFAGFKKGKVIGVSEFCLFSELNILEFPILMLLDSRQRLYNNLSDHFIDQILKMFIYLTLGRENLAIGIRFSK